MERERRGVAFARGPDDQADLLCAESFLAGTASCRIEVKDVDALFLELEPRGVLHDVSRGGVRATDCGSREFTTIDLDGNLLTFFRWERT